MKRCLSIIVLSLTLYPTLSQTLQLGIVDHYGVKAVRQQAEACIPFSKNDTINFLTNSTSADSVKKKMRECLKALPGVKQTDIFLVCCDAVEGKVMLFIGALNKPMKSTAVTKTEDKKLPAEIIQSYDSLMQLTMEIVISGQGQEDDSEGHALLEFPAARKIQLRFRIYAKQHLEILRHVIRYSKYPEHRAAAATVLAYHDNKNSIIVDLMVGVMDIDDGVRNDAIRALGILAGFAMKNPTLNISIRASPFIELLNSVSWTDLNKAGFILLSLTANGNQKILKQLKREALGPLTDMALWKSEGHAMPGFMILGRIAGWTDKEIYEAIKANRVEMVAKMLNDIQS